MKTKAQSRREKIADPRWFVPRMRIIDEQGKRCTLLTSSYGLLPAQKKLLDVWGSSSHILYLKARQQGITTVTMLALLHSAVLSKDALNTLSITHEGGAVGRITRMLRAAIKGLPSFLRPRLEKDNVGEMALGHNESQFHQLMAGGRGQARSDTYQRVHATEMGFWPKGSSAREGMSIDEDAFSSAMSTCHAGPNQRVIIESTAWGPSGVFYKMYRQAQESSAWTFLFSAWFEDPKYRLAVPVGWERRDDEEELANLYGVDDGQLAWRRFKIEDEGYGLHRFRREYPSNPEDPWLVSTGLWYDATNLQRILALIPAARHNQRDGWTYYYPFEPHRRYYEGVDPSGGTGRDQGVIQIVRDDLVQVAVYASRNTPPHMLAEEAAKAAAQYGGCPILVEYNNKFGRAVYDRMKALGANLWVQGDGKPWYTDARTKAQLHDWGKLLIDQGHVRFEDPLTVQEFLHVREQENGNIEADPGYPDDRVMALVLALWCARRAFSGGRRHSVEAAIARQRERRHRQLGV